MSDLRETLLRIGSKRPELRKHIRPVIDSIGSRTAMTSAGRVSQQIDKAEYALANLKNEMRKLQKVSQDPRRVTRNISSFASEVEEAGKVIQGLASKLDKWSNQRGASNRQARNPVIPTPQDVEQEILENAVEILKGQQTHTADTAEEAVEVAIKNLRRMYNEQFDHFRRDRRLIKRVDIWSRK